MSEVDKLFAGSIPALYDRHLGQLMFEPYAVDLAERIVRLQPGRLLEIAAGTGIVTRALVRHLGADTAILATDLNQPMLDFADAQTAAANVTFRKADALSLPYDDSSFDVVVCQFGVMFFPDRPAAYREARRVLKPGGRFLFNVWDRLAENEFADVVSHAVAALFPDNPPGFLGRTPYGYFDTVAIRGALGEAGFRRTEVETLARQSHAPSSRDAAIGFCEGTPLRNEIEAKGPGHLEKAVDAATTALAARFGSGAIDGRLRAYVITALR
jgi:SAM-dependent methyltransferase